MKRLATLLALFAIAVPTHATSPGACRTATGSRANHVRIATTSHSANHHTAQATFVITAFTVPVAVPVAPFAPYWYGVSDYQDSLSLRGATSGRTAREALPRETLREAEPRHPGAPGSSGGASEPERSVVTQNCTSCHGRTSPKQGLSLVDLPSLSATDRLRAIRAVVTGAMPPDTEPRINEEERTALVRELTSDTAATEQDQNDE